MAELRATPYENPLTGLSNDLIQGLLGYMKDKQRTQQMQGLAGLLESTGIPKTVERAAYADSPTALLNALTNVNRANVPLLKPETADALMTLAPVPSGAGRATKAIDPLVQKYGPRLEKAIEPTLEVGYNKGGITREMIEAMGTNTRSLLDVYHGTPHTLPPTAKNSLGEFDASKIGTGEGAQAYGHGIYVAENPAVAKDYADKLSTVGWRRDDAFMDYDAMTMDAIRNDLRHNSLDDIVKQNKQYADSAKQTGEKSVMADMYNAIVSGDVGLNGNLYKADLPDEQIAKMLDYDKTWKQQPKNVQDAINVDKLLKYYGTDDISTSQVLYHAKQNMSPVAFAEFLRSKGVPGIKYLDEGSRAEGQGTRNFVVFPGEEKSMTILERNGLLADQLKALPEEKKKEILNLLDY